MNDLLEALMSGENGMNNSSNVLQIHTVQQLVAAFPGTLLRIPIKLVKKEELFLTEKFMVTKQIYHMVVESVVDGESYECAVEPSFESDAVEVGKYYIATLIPIGFNVSHRLPDGSRSPHRHLMAWDIQFLDGKALEANQAMAAVDTSKEFRAIVDRSIEEGAMISTDNPSALLDKLQQLREAVEEGTMEPEEATIETLKFVQELKYN